MVVVANLTIRNIGDAYVSSTTVNQKKNFHDTQKLYVRSGNPNTCYGYIFFGIPFPLGAKILSARLELWGGAAFSGTVSAQMISQTWSRDTVNYVNKPDVTGVIGSLNKSGGVNANWSVDVTAVMQQVADGIPWYGIRLSMSANSGNWFYGSASTTEKYRPVLVIDYVESPGIPVSLSPANGNAVSVANPLLNWKWTDDKGGTSLQQVRVQIASNSTFTSGLWDSGWQNATAPELNLAATNYPGLAVGSTAYWRAMVRNAAGQPSVWSEVASFTRAALPTVNINNPIGLDGDAYVEENTPLIGWDAVASQVAFQVIIYDTEDNMRIVADSGKINSSDNGWYPPDTTQLVQDGWYRVDVRVWDNVPRENNYSSPPYAVARKTFQVRFSSTVTPVTAFTVTQVKPYNFAKLEWVRATAPDYFDVYLNGKATRISPEDISIDANGKWTYYHYATPPRKSNVWKVVPVVNGRAASSAPSQTTTFRVTSAILSEVNGTNPIVVLNYENDHRERKNQTVHEVVGPYAPVLIKQALGGLSGSFSGGLYGSAVAGVSADEELRRFDLLRKDEGREVLFTYLNRSFRCFLSDSNVIEAADGEGLFYLISFDYYQTDF